MNATVKLIGVLTLTCLGAGLLLAWVQDVTREPIARAEAARRLAAIREVLPEAPEPLKELAVTDPLDGREQRLLARFDADGRWTALALESRSDAGYAGPITLMVGMVRDADDTLTLSGVYILGHAETPGLGAKIQDAEFRARLAGRPVRTTRWQLKDAGDIDGISAATISSEAVLEALRQAFARIERLSDAIVESATLPAEQP